MVYRQKNNGHNFDITINLKRYRYKIGYSVYYMYVHTILFMELQKKTIFCVVLAVY